MKHTLTAESLHPATEPATGADIRHVYIESGVSLDVAVADARVQPDDPTVLFFLPWSEYVARPDAMDRYRLLADAMSARVIALDNLGMGPAAAPIPASIRRDIEHGNFGGNVEVQIEAMHRLDISLAHVSLMGYSLGTSMAAQFARQLEGYGEVDALTLCEPVGMTRQHTVPLMRKFARETLMWARDRDDAQKIHPDWMAEPGLRREAAVHMARHVRDYMAYARGLATAPLVADMRTAYEAAIAADTPIRVVNGGGSVISRTDENERLVADLRSIGYRHVTHDVYADESHGVIDVPLKAIAMLTARHG